MSRFEEKINLAEQKYLNKNSSPTVKPGHKTDTIFQEQGVDLFDQSTKKKPGMFTRIKRGVTGAANKLSNAQQSLARFNQDAEQYGTMAALGARHEPGEEEQEQPDGTSLFNQPSTQNTRQPNNQTQQPGTNPNNANQARWEQYSKPIWDKMSLQDKQRFNNNMNEYIKFLQDQARAGGQR
jgi:hypothetical protein